MEEKDYTAPAILLGVIIFVVIIKSIDTNIKFTDSMSAIATLIAAFVGAKAAFSMQDKSKKEEISKKVRAAVNQTLFLLADMWKNLNGYNKQALAYALNTPAPWLSMKYKISYVDIKLPHQDLLFLLETKYANLYLELLHTEQMYNITCDTLKLLYEVHSGELQPKLEQLGYSFHGIIDVNILENQLGPVLVTKLKDMTNDAIIEVPKQMAALIETFNKFRGAMTEHFAGCTVINLEFYE